MEWKWRIVHCQQQRKIGWIQEADDSKYLSEQLGIDWDTSIFFLYFASAWLLLKMCTNIPSNLIQLDAMQLK